MLIRKPILMYHSTAIDPDLRVNVTPEALAGHLEYLSNQDLRCRSVLEHLRTPAGNSVGLSFDDGYLNNLDILPLLKQHGAGATFFVLTGCEGETLDCHRPQEVPIMGPDGWRY